MWEFLTLIKLHFQEMSLPDFVDGISGISNVVDLEEIGSVSSEAEKRIWVLKVAVASKPLKYHST